MYLDKITTKFILTKPIKTLSIGLLFLNVFPGLSVARPSPVKLTFSMLTASHAAVGVPMTYQSSLPTLAPQLPKQEQR